MQESLQVYRKWGNFHGIHSTWIFAVIFFAVQGQGTIYRGKDSWENFRASLKNCENCKSLAK